MLKQILSLGLLCLLFPNSFADTPALKWTLQQGLDKPESVVYDAARDRLYVSNVQGNPPEKDGKGYIATVSLDGKLLEKEWLKDLNAPKGMVIVGDKLYVSDVDALVEIDVVAAKITQRYEAKGAKFLNDVTADAQKNIYVSDMFDDKIYCLCDGKFAVWLSSAELTAPNGLLAEKNRLIVGSWGKIKEGFTTEVPGYLKAIDYQTKKISSLGSDKPVGNLDGVESDGKDGYYVSDWMVGKLFHFDAQGEATEIMKLKQGSADNLYLAEQHLLLIPMMLDNELKAFELK